LVAQTEERFPVNILRRLPLSRLLLLCGIALAVGVGSTALALALGGGPTPPPKGLADAVHDALAGANAHPIEGVSARIQFTNHLIEGASLAGGSNGEAGQLASSPLLSGASGRLWISKDGRVRLELQSEKGDSQLMYDGHTASLYDGSSNTLYRYTPPAEAAHPPPGSSCPPTCGPGESVQHEAPSVAKIEEAISHLKEHTNVSGATPTDVAGQPAYTVRISPNEGGSLIGGAELSFDSTQGAPLRAAIYSTTSSAPVIELASTEVSYGPVPDLVFEFTPPANAKIEEVSLPGHDESPSGQPEGTKPKTTIHGQGISAIAELESKAKSGSGGESGTLEGLKKVDINGTSASELPTELGTILSFERSGIRYVLAGSVAPAAIEALAKGL
jgi:outer membrane lipoprotein-sorting protein